MIQDTSKDIVRCLKKNIILTTVNIATVRNILKEDTLSYEELKDWALFLTDILEDNTKIEEGAAKTIELLSRLP